jgi:hypothetical protein
MTITAATVPLQPGLAQERAALARHRAATRAVAALPLALRL